MRLLFALPGFHRYDRGAEIALLSVARELALGGDEVTVIGSGEARPGNPYTYRRIPSVRRERFERFPRLPMFRDETAWEDATFAAGLRARVDLSAFDATVTCSFPHTHWALRKRGCGRPLNFFVTQNGDWPARAKQAEYRYFSCDGLVCTNPEYFRRNATEWNSVLVPNGVDLAKFSSAQANKARFGLPERKPVVLMVSALIASKRVSDAIEAVADMRDVFLIVAGDGPLRGEVQTLADRLLPGNFTRVSLTSEEMPSLYRSADVFLHMSESESFGNVYLEAMASGLPVVAHESENLRWIVGDGQYLCDTRKRGAVAEQVAAALAGPAASDEARLQRFAWPRIAGEYRAFIDQTLRQNAASPLRSGGISTNFKRGNGR